MMAILLASIRVELPSSSSSALSNGSAASVSLAQLSARLVLQEMPPPPARSRRIEHVHLRQLFDTSSQSDFSCLREMQLHMCGTRFCIFRTTLCSGLEVAVKAAVRPRVPVVNNMWMRKSRTALRAEGARMQQAYSIVEQAQKHDECGALTKLDYVPLVKPFAVLEFMDSGNALNRAMSLRPRELKSNQTFAVPVLVMQFLPSTQRMNQAVSKCGPLLVNDHFDTKGMNEAIEHNSQAVRALLCTVHVLHQRNVQLLDLVTTNVLITGAPEKFLCSQIHVSSDEEKQLYTRATRVREWTHKVHNSHISAVTPIWTANRELQVWPQDWRFYLIDLEERQDLARYSYVRHAMQRANGNATRAMLEVYRRAARLVFEVTAPVAYKSLAIAAGGLDYVLDRNSHSVRLLHHSASVADYLCRLAALISKKHWREEEIRQYANNSIGEHYSSLFMSILKSIGGPSTLESLYVGGSCHNPQQLFADPQSRKARRPAVLEHRFVRNINTIHQLQKATRKSRPRKVCRQMVALLNDALLCRKLGFTDPQNHGEDSILQQAVEQLMSCSAISAFEVLKPAACSCPNVPSSKD
ncbi:MAG: hypothetical protein MHM6MM_001335 [Cercozoa sp. M6MM]